MNNRREVFKSYHMDQPQLLPQSLEELTPEDHLVRVVNRVIETETVFGDIKYNQGFCRFSLRGLRKVETRWGILSVSHNLRKLAAQ